MLRWKGGMEGIKEMEAMEEHTVANTLTIFNRFIF